MNKVSRTYKFSPIIDRLVEKTARDIGATKTAVIENAVREYVASRHIKAIKDATTSEQETNSCKGKEQ